MKLLTYLFLLLSLLIFSSCSRGKLIEEYTFTEDMYSQIPFKGFENLKYIDNYGDSVIVLGGARVNKINKVFDCVNCSDYYYFENDYIYFENDSCKIGLYMDAAPIYRFYIQFTISGVYFDCDFQDNLPLSKYNLKMHEMFYDSIIVNNTIYHSVFGDTLVHEGEIPLGTYPVFCYYSTEYGIIKIDFSDNSSWELKSIVW